MLRLLILTGLISSTSAYAQTIEIVTPQKTVKLTLKQMKQKLITHLVKINDPVYKKEKMFDAFVLNDVLDMAEVPTTGSLNEIVFTAKDTYAPNTSFAKLKAHRAYLAYQEHGMKGYFGKVAQGKKMVSPAPFYVVWAEGAALEHEVPWPYQLVKIEVVDFAQKFTRLYPAGLQPDSREYKGFVTFKNQCMQCHSINLQGGDVGPELNAPMSVTEYWSETHLRALIKDASSFRYKSKMPAFPNLSDEQISELLAYLTVMKNHKIPAEK